MNTYFLITIMLLVTVMTYGQPKTLRLEEAIAYAQKSSVDYKIAENRYQSSLWSYKNYKASFLPSLYLDGTVPNYSRSISKITLPNGEDSFVNQNQAFTALNLSVRQQVALTGGILAIGSSLDRIDVFGRSRQVNYATVPASISYTQNMIGYNPVKWRKHIEPLRMQVADRALVSSMQQIGLQTISYYFNILQAQTTLQLSRQNLAEADTLYRINKDRFRLGTVTQSELLQLRLNILNASQQVTQDSVSHVLARQQFSSYIGMYGYTDYVLEVPERVDLFPVSFEQMLIYAKENGQEYLDYKVRLLEAEQQMEKANAENRLTFSVQGNFGLSNTGNTFSNLLNNMSNQQNIKVSFSVPILDWGVTRSQRLQAKANLTVVKGQIEQAQNQLEQDVALQSSKWNLYQRQLAVIKESKEIAKENYELEVQRFMAGAITINDLNIARGRQENATLNYIASIRSYWELCYTIRKITLYDFKTNQKIKIQLSSVNQSE